MSARQQMVDKAEAAATRGEHKLAEMLRARVKMWDATDWGWAHMDATDQIPRRADGAAERCECNAETQLCSCEPLRTDTTQSKKRTDMSDPVEKARLERDARNKRAAFAGADSTRHDSAREELETEKAAQARRAAARSASLDIALKRQQQSRVDAHQAREAMIAERRAACAPTTTAPTVPDSVREELAEETRRERLRRNAMGSRMLREQAERNR